MGLQSRDLFDQGQPSAHGPLGIVFVRLRPAEIGEHAIAQILGDVTFEPLGHGGGAALVRAYDAAQVLGVEPRRQLGRTDQVTEQHGQLPSLGLNRPRRHGDHLRGSRGPSMVERGDGIEKLSPVSD
jgi:hypothetical protein